MTTPATPTIPPAPSDAELDTYIRTRYALLGVDISVLPVDDPTAVMDQRRLLSNGRSILRDEVEIADVPLDPQRHIPVLYPAPFSAWTEQDR